MPWTTFRVVIIFLEAMYFFFKNGFTVHGLFLYPLRYPDFYIRRRIRTFDTQGVENNIELSSMLYWICSITLWRYSETHIRSYTSCFLRAPSRHSHGERSLSASWRKYFYQRTNVALLRLLIPASMPHRPSWISLRSISNWINQVALPGFEPGFLYRQHGSKCASLLNFSERFFGASAKSIRYSA